MLKKLCYTVLIIILLGCSRSAVTYKRQSADDRIITRLYEQEREQDIVKREKILREIINDASEDPGRGHQTTVLARLALAQVLIEQGKDAEGARILLELDRTSQEAFHPVRAEILSLLGNYYLNRAELEKSIYYYKKALEVTDKNFGVNSAQSGKICLALADVEKEVRNFSEAKKYISRAYNAADSHPDTDDFDRADIANTEAELFIDLEDFEKSYSAAIRALEEDEKHPERGILP
ncbi:MAG: hypothetical protein J7M18_04330, partial [Candidatus Eremiobacteraeota bacterium]|nr:hypothetical protein [Candidatus Eremiobacteraeota bacterium]